MNRDGVNQDLELQNAKKIEAQRQLRVLNLVELVLFCFGLVAVISFVVHGQAGLALLIAGHCMLAAIAIPVLRSLGRLQLLGHILIGLLLAVVIISNYFTGGLRGSNDVVFLLVPIASVLLLGKGYWPWIALSVGAIASFQYGMFSGYPFPDIVPPQDREWDMIMSWVFTLISLVITMTYYERSRRRASEQVELAVERAEAANRAKGQFVANISHELRTPMNAIIGVSDLMLSSKMEEGQCCNLTLIKKNAVSLLRLVEEVLDMSRIDAGKMEIHQAPFEPRALAVEAMENLRMRAEQKGIALELAVDPSTPPHVRGDAFRVRQILINLLDNAVKFTDVGSVSLALDKSKEGELLFTVQDTGVGIAKEARERIFESFWQVDGSASRRHSGAGLGLAICRQLAQRMYGSIGVESELGQGSTFWVRLPLPAVAAQTISGIPRILAVDDDPVGRELARAILQKHGYLVEVAASGTQAVQMVKDGEYSLVLMDIQLPGMDGVEATRQIRAEEKHPGRLPILAMTAHVFCEERDRCFEAGMNDFISKPVDAASLLLAVSRWAGKKETLDSKTQNVSVR